MKMKAFQVMGYGGLDQLQEVELDIPELKEDEVLVKVHATALNNSDIWMREGGYGSESSPSGWRPEGVQFPRIPGSDVAGKIVEIGSGVSREMLNKKVVLFPFQSTGESGYEHMSEDMRYLGSEFDGGYAEYVVWKADLCYDAPLPNLTESATFSVSGLTAWHMLKRAQIQKGEKVLVTGATGGVGFLAVQIASKIFGADVIAAVRDVSMRETMQELGAKEVVSYKSSSLLEDIYDAAGGKVDVVLDVVGKALLSVSLAALKIGGRYVVSGSSSGPVSEVDLRTIYLKHLNLYGSTLGTRAEYADLMQAVADGTIRPIIDKTFPLDQTREAQDYFKKSKKLGKVVLIPHK